LTLRAPVTPGTTSRSGAPWSVGSGAPFISYASSTSQWRLSARSAVMDAA
jgi:hypothetical protein